jgi:hypothetical protein
MAAADNAAFKKPHLVWGARVTDQLCPDKSALAL